jgi:hypothetical protein
MVGKPVKLLLPIAVVAAVLAFYASGASAAPQSFCGTAKGIAASIVHSGNMISPTGGESLQTVERKLKNSYAAIIKAQPALLGSAPGSIKPDLQKAFAAIDYINAKMKAVGWDFTKVAPFAQALAARAAAARPALTRLDAYFKGTCHIAGA